MFRDIKAVVVMGLIISIGLAGILFSTTVPSITGYVILGDDSFSMFANPSVMLLEVLVISLIFGYLYSKP